MFVNGTALKGASLVAVVRTKKLSMRLTISDGDI